MRRSNSSSNIPLPKVNLFGSRGSTARASIRRSQSVSRLSQRDSAAPLQLRQSRKSSLDRKSNNVLGLPRTTPMSGRAGSLQRTTPSSALSQRTNKMSTTPLSGHKERQTIQKLSNDKKWVAEQYMKVQNFIVSSSLFDLSKVNVNSLKPPTINTFIYITAVLFKEISPKIKINNENYKEVVPTQLKVLQFPGTLSNSLLKTVNTSHSWPQVVGMWSWLIDRVNIARSAEDESFLEFVEPEVRLTYLLKKNCWDHIINSYKLFNADEYDNEKIEEANDAYVRNLAEILEVDFEKFQKVEAEVLEKREYKKKQEAEIEHLMVEKTRVQSEIEQMKSEIEDFHEADVIREKDLENQLEINQENLNSVRAKKDDLKKSVNQLEEALKAQPCTYKEKLDLLHQIDQLKDEIQVKKEKIEHAQTIKNKFDHMLTNEINKMQNMVIQWNRSLMELCIKKPELKKLLLRERGFQDPEFLTEIQETLNCKIAIEIEISKAVTKIESDLKIKEETKQELEKRIEELICVTHSAKQESQKLNENIDSLKKDMKELSISLEETKKIHKEQMSAIQQNSDLEEQTGHVSELKDKKEALETEITKFSQKMLSFFFELHSQVTNNIKEMDKVRINITENFEGRVLNMLEKQRQLVDVLKTFNETE